MSLVAWLVFGLIAGLIATWIAGGLAIGCGCGTGCLVLAAVGIAGAALGSIIFNMLGLPVFFGFGLRPFTAAVLGAVLVILVLRALKGRRH